MPGKTRRCRALIAVIVGAAALLSFARPAAAAGEDTYFVNAINAIRASRGVAPLAVDGQLAAVAQAWSAHMAATGTLQHNPAIATQVTGWRVLGENVGTGGVLDTIENAFENSPHHFENMVDPAFTHIGVAVVQDARGTYWVTEEFKQATGAKAVAPAPKPAAPVAPKPAPKPAAKPVAKPAPKPVTQAVVKPAAKPAPVAAAPATSVPVATTQPAPPPTVPVAVLGASTQQPASSAGAVPAGSPFTAAHLTGLVAAFVLGSAMAFYARVRVTRTQTATAG